MLFKIYLYLISLQKDVTKNALSTPEDYSFITHKSNTRFRLKTNKQTKNVSPYSAVLSVVKLAQEIILCP